MENKKRKILIVDDDIELQEMYAEILQNANFEVILANDGIEGLDKATKEMPDVIFTGIVMPRMDGFSMIESLKKIVMTSAIPVVISSHMGREEDKARANELGVKDFIIRGITRPVEVIERINALFTEIGSEYKLEFNPTALDAQRLAKEFNFQSNFKCLECGESLVLDLRLINTQNRAMEAKFVCSHCGSFAK
ncbi:MAG: Transcriptional regulator [Candidatus Moranbacteria bacterium GW2011_GWE1_36_7]|nr:MAG: Transcriptional regulator [Candidatus Moranbacteria bacterium GW2011_GWD2_36_12]KKQ06651.1 MAG: Transcriptional regulator [Candidatus Moranbacteria bacterium GW2011_GWE2_36_40]KKQ15199.1 MAG: Transcriptional regulator [Candidatus Moranbacteria bacterium GW2011_GWE1_36_7]